MAKGLSTHQFRRTQGWSKVATQGEPKGVILALRIQPGVKRVDLEEAQREMPAADPDEPTPPDEIVN